MCVQSLQRREIVASIVLYKNSVLNDADGRYTSSGREYGKKQVIPDVLNILRMYVKMESRHPTSVSKDEYVITSTGRIYVHATMA